MATTFTEDKKCKLVWTIFYFVKTFLLKINF